MQTEKIKKIKKILLLSVIILSVTGLISLWIINRLKASHISEDDKTKQQTFNTKMPDANLKESTKTKLEIYMQAQKDSAKLIEQQKKDSSDRRFFDPGPPEKDVFADEFPTPEKVKKPAGSSKNSIDQNEKKVNDRLEKLYAALNNNNSAKQKGSFSIYGDSDLPRNDADIARLEKLISAMQTDTTSNPEMKQVEAVLNLALDIQHPERVKERTKVNTTNITNSIFTATTSETSSFADSVSNTFTQNGFWGLQEQSPTDSEYLTTIPAIVHENQLLQNGSVIKLRLLHDIHVNNIRIPKDNFLYGECSITDQRLHIQFNSIAFSNTIFPVKLTAFDTDGNEGIYIPGAISRDVAKNGLNDAIQQMQLATLNPSISAQAATAGIQTAQNLISRKVKRIQVTVKAGHKVLLKTKGTN